MLLNCIIIAQSKQKGRGIFTTEALEAAVVVEVAPVIVMSKMDRQLLDKTLLHDYIFEWNNGQDSCAMALGYVPLYNHSYTSNCDYEMDYDTDTIIIKTTRPIIAGDELCINYNGSWNDEKPIWFKAT